MRKLGGLAFLFFAAPAAAQFYSFSDWERITFPEQVAYIMGAFDAMSVTKTLEDFNDGKYFRACLRTHQLTNQQLATSVLYFGHQHPERQKTPVQLVLERYLVALCGNPRSTNASPPANAYPSVR